MTSPKFSVGEEVIVISLNNSLPPFDGVVVGVWSPAPSVSKIAYRISPLIKSGDWDELCLRKKHKPGDSFEAIMNSCKAGEIA